MGSIKKMDALAVERAQPRKALGRSCGVQTRAAANLSHMQGDNTNRKAKLQTKATNPSVGAASLAETDLVSVQEQLEKLYVLEEGHEETVKALQDVDALLEDLQGLDEELESVLATAREELKDLTVCFVVFVFCSVNMWSIQFTILSFLLYIV